MTTAASSLRRNPSLLAGTTDASRVAWGPLETVLLAGLAVAACDITDALLYFPAYYDISRMRVFHSVAAGLIGREAALAGGVATAVLGGFLHVCVATCIALVYYLFSRRIPMMVQRPVLSGLVFGVAAFFVMSYVVVPLSAAGRGIPHDTPWPTLANGILGHAFLVGLPAALVVRRGARGTAPLSGDSARE
jgi:hypothetical protein